MQWTRRWMRTDVLSSWWPVTRLSVGPHPLMSRRSCPRAAPSDDRRGFSRVPWPPREARACSATPIAATRPSSVHSGVLLATRWSWEPPTFRRVLRPCSAHLADQQCAMQIGAKTRSGRRGIAPTGSREVSSPTAALSKDGLRVGLHQLLVVLPGGFHDALPRRPLGAECGYEGVVLAAQNRYVRV